MIGLAMLGVFAVCAALMWTRIVPAILAVPLMALAIAALSGAGPHGIASVVVDGAPKLAAVMVTVVFGALLSRVTMQTGIAETIVNYAAEFGGDEPLWLAVVMAFVVALLFTSLYGLGAIIMVGSIVLPIMMTVGVPRRTAATLFMLAYALGFIFNITQWKLYTQLFGVTRAQLQPFAYALAGIDALVLVTFLIVDFRRTRGYATWALVPEEPIARKRVPLLALATPVVPLVLYFAFGIDPLLAFPLAALFGVVTARRSEAVETLVSAAIRGVEDVAPALLLFVGIGMLLAATALPQVRAALSPVVAAVAPHGPLGYVLLFGVLSPLALYRGPLNLYGVGVGVYTVLAGLGIMPPVTLVAAAMAVVQVQNACDPTNTQNVWVANFTGVRVGELMRATLPYQVTVATLATICVVLLGRALFGIAPFAAAQAAEAATLTWTGLAAPAAADHTVAIVHRNDDLSARAGDEIQRQIAHGWRGFHTVTPEEDPAASDCRDKAYAAVLRAEVSPADAALYLSDCAGWPVDEWHERGADTADASQRRALDLVLRLRTWMRDRPELASSLFSKGIAFDRRSGVPTYFYGLFKTPDGQMRAYVRPGGPAYASGLRTNDIVVKIDGKYWWEYGTYPSQSRAYDGLPHAFVVTRGGRETEVRLGSPYDGE